VFWFLCKFIWNILILRRNQRDSINVKTCSCKVPVIFVGFWWNLFSRHIFEKKTQISNFIKLRPVGAEFHVNGRKGGHKNASSRSSDFFKRSQKLCRQISCFTTSYVWAYKGNATFGLQWSVLPERIFRRTTQRVFGTTMLIRVCANSGISHLRIVAPHNPTCFYTVSSNTSRMVT
jgi:hypothetical protein